jgi:ferredoxin
MKVKVDGELCCGHARCWVAAPEFYRLDESGYSALRGKTVDVPKELEAAARRGAHTCPDNCIMVIED